MPKLQGGGDKKMKDKSNLIKILTYKSEYILQNPLQLFVSFTDSKLSTRRF